MMLPGVSQMLNVAIVIRSVDKFSATMGLAGTQALGLRQKYGALIGTISAMMDAPTLALTAVMALAAGMIKATQAAMEFEWQLVELHKVYAGQETEIDSVLVPAIRSIGEEYGLMADDVSAAMVRWAQQGKQGAELIKLTEEAIRLTMITTIDEARATEYLTAAINQFGLTADDTANIIATWNWLANTQTVTAAYLAEAITHTGATAKQFGMTLEDVSTYLTIFSRAGWQAGEAGRGLNAILTRLYRTQAIESLAAVGIAVMDANGNFRDANVILKELSEKWDTLTDYQKKNVTESVAGMRHYAQLNVLMEQFSDTQGMLADKTTMLDKANEEVNKTLATAHKQWEILQSKLHNLALDIGNMLLPVAKELFSSFGGIIDIMADVVTAIQPLVTEIGKLFTPLDDLKGYADDTKGGFGELLSVTADLREEFAGWIKDAEGNITVIQDEADALYNYNEQLYIMHKNMENLNVISAGLLAWQVEFGLLTDMNAEKLDALNEEIDDYYFWLSQVLSILFGVNIQLERSSDNLLTLEGRLKAQAKIMNIIVNPAIQALTFFVRGLNDILATLLSTLQKIKEEWKKIEEIGANLPAIKSGSPRFGSISGARPYGGRIYQAGVYQLEPGEVYTKDQARNSFGDIHIHINNPIGDTSDLVRQLKDQLKYELRGRGVM